MNDVTKIMWELQHYNDIVYRCRRESDEAVSALQSMEVLLKKESESVAKMKDSLLLVRRELKANEINLAEITNRIEQCESRKMTVSSSKELTSIDNELAKATNDKLISEEKIFEMMESLEKMESEYNGFCEKQKETNGKASENKGTLTNRIKRLNLILKENEEKYNALLPSLGSFRPKFEKLALSKDGKAIVAIENGACSGCRFTLSTDVMARVAISSEPLSCSNCGRYLYTE